jgi:hypothetical protein
VRDNVQLGLLCGKNEAGCQKQKSCKGKSHTF